MNYVNEQNMQEILNGIARKIGSGGGLGIVDWQIDTEYTVGQIVLYNNILYKCNTQHTSTTFSADSSNWDFIYSEIQDWTANTYYKANSNVIHDNKLYKCITSHTSSSTWSDVNWQLIGGDNSGTTIEDWATNTLYDVGDLVIYEYNIYQCNTQHTSSTFNADKNKWNLIGAGSGGASQTLYNSETWLNNDITITLNSAVTPYDFIILKVDYSIDGTATEISKTVIITNDLNTNVSLSLTRNSMQYCVLEGKLTTETTFAIDAIELNGFTKFRINKIIGVIGGGSSSGGGSGSSYSQITKYDVTAPLDENISINKTTDFCLPPVEVLKFQSGTQDVVTNIFNFDAGDGSSFTVDGVSADLDEQLEFDGKVHLVTSKELTMGTPVSIGDYDICESEEIDVDDYKSIEGLVNV